MDQVYLLFEKCEKDLLDKRRFDAILMANAVAYATPSYSQKDSSNKQRSWSKFMDSLDWEKLTTKKDAGSVKKQLVGLGIPVKKKKASE